jgi:hypothetical protein
MIALLGDSVFDNESYVNSREKAVESVVRNLGFDCKLYAVDGAVISDVYSQIKKLKSEVKLKDTIFLSVGGNNALGTLNLVYNNIHLSVDKLLLLLNDFLLKFEDELDRLYLQLSESFRETPIYVTNIYYPCFDFQDRNQFFHSLKEGGHQDKIIKLVDSLNAIIQKKAKEYSFGLVNINSAFHSKIFYANEIEPSFEGSKLLADLFRIVLKT